MSNQYDVAIIGAGPGGYVASIRAAQLGGRVCIIEKDLLGGVCLNKGCIPTKFLTAAVELVSRLKGASNYGIDISNYNIDFLKTLQQQDRIVVQLRNGIQTLLKARSIDLIKGTGKLVDKNSILVGDKKLTAKNIIIATGSRPQQLEFLKFDGVDILSSDDIWNLKTLPKTMLIIGAGAIGCEFAGIFSEFGCKVTVIEVMESILPNEDKEISKRLEVTLKKKGITIKANAKIKDFKKTQAGLVTMTEMGEEIVADKVLLCVGRIPNSEGLCLEELNIKMAKSAILVNRNLRTNIPNIYAIGDVISRHPQLAHVASYDGIVAAENIFGESRETDYTVIPNCVFSTPQIGSVGLTEEMAKALGIDIKVGKFPFSASGKAQILNQTEGLIKVVTDSNTKKILGVHIMGPNAAELIATATIAIKMNMTTDKLIDTIIAHPTLAESIIEAAHSLYGGAIHAL